MTDTATKTVEACIALKNNWNTRNQKFLDWYELLTMEDNLKQTNLESFCSNEPRTFYNLALHLLTPSTLPHRIPLENLEPDQIEDAAIIERFLNYHYCLKERNAMRKGRAGFMRELVAFILATGWYSIFSMATDDDIVAEIWNPADTFPEYSDDGLLRCAHIYSLTSAAAKRKIIDRGWKVDIPPTGAATIFDYWTMENGIAQNSIVLVCGQKHEVKPLTDEPTLKKLPVYTGPVAGLPDRGSIISGNTWTKTVGQSILAPNERIYDYTNRTMTMVMQLLRDTAQPRWVERSTGDPVVNPDDIFKRGAVFHLNINESLEPLQANVMPFELRTALFDISQMRQKGSMPDALFGSAGGELTGYMMAQVAGAASHVLKPYQEAIKFLLEELDNDWLEDIHRLNLHPYGKTIPWLDERVEVDLRVEIPGEFVQRATVARMLDPDFSLSYQTVVDELFPQIDNPVQEQARTNADKAQSHPVMDEVRLIQALRTKANELRKAGNTESANLCEKAAVNLTTQVTGQQQQPGVPSPRPEVQPRQAVPEEFK